MSMRRVGMLAMAGLASLVVACSSSPSSPQSGATSGQGSSSAAAGSPTTIPGTVTPGEQPVVLHKQIGETAGIGCPDDPAQPCDVSLVITSIQSGVQCTGGTDGPLKPDEQLVRIDMDITTDSQFQYPAVSSALWTANWGIGDASGVVPELDLYFGEGEACLSDQGLNALRPGTHFKNSYLVTAPKSSTILRLYNGPAGDGWTWDVPPLAG